MENQPHLVRQTTTRRLRWASPPLLVALGLSAAASTGCQVDVGSDAGFGSNTGIGAASSMGNSSSDGAGGAPTKGPSSGGSGNAPSGTGGAEAPQTIVFGDGLKIQGSPAYYNVVRLTHEQWERSVQDIFELDAPPGLSSGFHPDPPEGKFSNNEKALYVNDTLRADYQRSAEAIADLVVRDSAKLSSLGAGNASGFIEKLGKRAFRRDLTPDEVAQYEELWAAGADAIASGDDTVDGARIVIEALLQAPSFVYRVQLPDSTGRLSGHELATKLSFLLSGTTPSDELLEQADAGELDTDAGLLAVATDLIDEAATVAAATNFHRELFGLDRYRSILKSQQAFPSYTESVNQTLLDADLMFFDHVFTSEGGYRDILLSDVAFVDGPTSQFYGVDRPGAGGALTQISLDETRPGILTRLGFLALNASSSTPDPIHRGVDINNRLLCANLSPPSGEIPPLPEPDPEQTNRERVTAHTGEGFCAGCHLGQINPPGFALEGFDALGQIRTTDNGKPIDTADVFYAGEEELSFTGIQDLAPALAESTTAHACYTANLAEFALSRDLGAGDTPLLESVFSASKDDSASLKEMLLKLISSSEFATARTAQ